MVPPSASLDDALQDLTRATQIAPQTVPHRVELGITFASGRRWREANENLEKALAMPQAWVTDAVLPGTKRVRLSRQ